jgi:hypothetical protein
MPEIQNAMEIFKLLDKSNCRKCNEATCLAFAAAVFQGRRQISECPHLDQKIVEQYSGEVKKKKTPELDIEAAVSNLQKEIESVDLMAAARRLGGVYEKGKLTLKILGKDLSVDQKGRFYSDIHIHPWVSVPVLNHILMGKGRDVLEKWVPFRELTGGKTWYRLFGQRCEKPLKQLADHYTDLFEDMVHLFGGTQVERHYDSDISVVLHALPKIPILFCYWKPDEGIGSDMHLFFDATAETNLNIESLFTLGTGLTMMFEKLARRHG